MLLINPVTGEIIDANREAVRYYGHDREKLLKLSINEINALSPERVALARQQACMARRFRLCMLGFRGTSRCRGLCHSD